MSNEELYREVNCFMCGVRFTIELARGEPRAAVCTKCEQKVNHKLAQRVNSERSGGEDAAAVRQRE